MLPSAIVPSAAGSGVPFALIGPAIGAAYDSARFTPGRWAIAPSNVPFEFGGAPTMPRSDGLVLRKKEEYDDCVRRAPAITPIARPPSSPTRSTSAT